MDAPLRPALMRPVVLVTGATGRTGQLVVAALISSGAAAVRVLARATSVLPGGWDSVDVRRGDLGDPASVAGAMSGVEVLVLLSPMDPSLDSLEATAMSAAESSGVRHVVKISTTVPAEDSPISWWRAHARSERRLRESPVAWTILRPNGIAFFLLDYAASVRAESVMQTAAPDGRMALIHPADIADVVAAVVRDPSRYSGATLDITGPEALSYDDVAALLSDLLGRHVRHVAEPADAVRARLLGDGLPDWQVEGVVANFAMTRGDAYGFDRVTATVRDITGHPPRTVADFLREHLGSFAAAGYPAD